MDAPFHFFRRWPDHRPGGARPLHRTDHAGALAVCEPGLVIDVDAVAPHAERSATNRRVVFNTRWHHRWGADDYFTAHPVITGPAAKFLVDCGVELVGVDTPSVDRPPFPAHLELLGAGLLIVENLTNLDAITGDEFELIALPLAIAGRDGSPVRAVAML